MGLPGLPVDAPGPGSASLPCARHPELPCREQGYPHCLGPVHWEHRSYKRGEREGLVLAGMTSCPWARHVRAWLIKHDLAAPPNPLRV